MNRTLLNTLLFSACLAVGVNVAQAAGTTALDLTVKTTITTGTCTAQVMDGSTETNTIAIGNASIAEVIQKLKTKSFKVRFSNCAGLPNSKALLTINKRSGGCAGGSSNDAEFANSSTSASKASAVALELWSGSTPGGADGVQFNCYSPVAQEIDVSTATGATNVDYPLSARLMKPAGKDDSAVTAGDFVAQTVFTIDYQ
ncbi:fimbrial protein [Citrobacter freundii]|uniref:Fimbrial protein n=1 Tax=Citrobacter portucalensis TaxID=1639133 RepID=A0A9X4GLY1_9ENTR|nr:MULTISPECIES: fimbrial protein [Citrobacter freundii complex]MDE9617638.1 fimbrial protein [Citrobacter portucalensis]QLR79019.1 fimbrial protein [Citrobacter freundii]